MKMPTNDGGSAFPVAEQFDEQRGEYVKYAEDGMTLRDYFAAKALSCAMSNGWDFGVTPIPAKVADDFAMMAYEIADAMIKARQS